MEKDSKLSLENRKNMAENLKRLMVTQKNVQPTDLTGPQKNDLKPKIDNETLKTKLLSLGKKASPVDIQKFYKTILNEPNLSEEKKRQIFDEFTRQMIEAMNN